MTALQILLLTLGGALAYEGLGWALAPQALRDVYSRMMEEMDDRQLGLAGLLSLLAGLFCIVLAVL